MPTWLLAAAGVTVWAVLILLPLVVLYAGAVRPAAQAWPAANVSGLALRSFLWAGGVAAAAVLLGYVPGRLLGAAGKYRTTLLLLLLMPLLLPRYLMYYAWAMLLTPTSWIGSITSANPTLARAAGATTSAMVMFLWYWPLAALLIGQGWRTMDQDAQDSARLESGRVRRFVRVTLPLLAWPLALAFGVCFAMSLSEFGTFHLAGVRTIGSELALVYQETGSAGAVVRAAWPMVIPAVLVGLLLWRRSKDWAVNPPLDKDDLRPRRRQWAVTIALLGFTILLPLGLLAGNLRDLAPLRTFYEEHQDQLGWSLLTSVGAGGLAVLMAAGALAVEALGRLGRWCSAIVHVTIFLAMFLPGSIVAVALLRTMVLFGLPPVFRDGWYVVSAGQAARFAGLVLILFRLAADSRDRHFSEMASVDGASPAAAWLHVHLPRNWPMVLGAFLLAVMLAMTEWPAAMVLLPGGVPNFAQWLLNQMHYLGDQHVITSCLILAGVYLILAVVVVALFRAIRGRAGTAVLLCVVGLCLVGCDSGADTPGEVEVLDVFGRTGRGRCEFIYPRAIDLGPDGSLFVIDKTGRIQRLSRAGEFLGVIQMPLIEAGKPTGISVGPDGNLYVADTHYHRIVVFSPDGKIIRQFGRFGEADGGFIYPTDVAFAPDGRIFVSEYGGNDRVSIFSQQGEFLGSFGSPGSGAGFLSRPAALCVDPRRQRLYVADACNHRIAIYNLGGKLTGYIGSVGRGPGQLRYPYDLALTDDGNLLVCEYGNNRLQLFSPDGASLGTFGGAGRQLGQLAYPWGVAVDGRGRAYVVDAGNNRIQVWQL